LQEWEKKDATAKAASLEKPSREICCKGEDSYKIEGMLQENVRNRLKLTLKGGGPDGSFINWDLFTRCDIKIGIMIDQGNQNLNSWSQGCRNWDHDRPRQLKCDQMGPGWTKLGSCLTKLTKM
jgi:hypothetical protein